MKNFNPNELQGKEKINRMFELMAKLTPKQSVNKIEALEFIKEGPDKKVYGIVRENKKYYIKSTEKTTNVISEDFEYIGGLKRSQDFAFDTYSEALKRLNFMMIDIANNPSFLTESTGTSTTISDKSLLSEEKRYKMKLKGAAPAAAPTPAPAPAPAPAAPSPAPAAGGMETATEPAPAEGGDDTSADMGGSPDNGGEGNPDNGGNTEGDDEHVTKKDVQKLTGKLGQNLRDIDKDEKDDDLMKYVINSVLGSVDMSLLSDEDKQGFMDKIENSMDDDDSDSDSEDQGDDNSDEDDSSDSEMPDLNESLDDDLDHVIGEMTQNLRGYFDFDDEGIKRDRYNPEDTND